MATTFLSMLFAYCFHHLHSVLLTLPCKSGVAFVAQEKCGTMLYCKRNVAHVIPESIVNCPREESVIGFIILISNVAIRKVAEKLW